MQLSSTFGAYLRNELRNALITRDSRCRIIGYIRLQSKQLILNVKLGSQLTHWSRVTHICVVKLAIIGSDNGLSPERRHTIIWTNAGILFIGPLGTNFSEILIETQTFSLTKIRLKMLSAKCCSFLLGFNVLTACWIALPPAEGYHQGVMSDNL